MADWFETDDPNVVASSDGREVPRSLLPPTDRIMPAPAGAAPIATPISPSLAPTGGGDAPPGLTPRVQATLAKLDDPSIAAARGQAQPQLPISQQTTTTQSGIPMSALKPVMDRGTERGESAAQLAEQLGEEKARIGEQQAMTASTAAYGQMVTSQAEADQARQRAEIARQNQLAIAAQKDESIDPDRFVRSMSTGQSIGTVILAAIEGAFRGMTGQAGQSGVLDILERRIDQDLMAQKEQIASGRIRRGNMIAYFQQQGMTEEAAEKAARAMAFAQFDRLTQSEIARQGAGMARPEGKALAEAIRARTEQENDQLMLANQPRSSTTIVRAPAGGGDGDIIMKAVQRDKVLEEQGYTREQRAAILAREGLAAPGGATAAERKGEGDLSEAQGKAQAAAESINAFAQAAGLVRDPNTGKWKTGEGIVPPALLEKINPFSDNTIKSRFEAAVEAYGRMQSGGVIGDDERKAFREQLGEGTSTREQLAARLNAADTTLSSRQAARARRPEGGAESAGFRKVAP